MRLEQTVEKKMTNAWLDFKYIYEIYHRVKFLWQKDILYKKYPKRKEKLKDKVKKYQY